MNKKTPAAKPASTATAAPSLKDRAALRERLEAVKAGAPHVADPRDAVKALAEAMLDHLGE